MSPYPLSAVLVALLAASGSAQIKLPATIDDTTFGPLKTGNTYVTETTVQVPVGKTQTIQPGVVIKFKKGTSLFVRGTLLANGTKAQRIFLTSTHDDSVGVKIGTRAPAPGDWATFRFFDMADNSVLRSVTVRYGGDAAPSQRAQMLVSRADIRMDDVAITQGSASGLSLVGRNPFTLPRLTGCRIDDHPGIAVEGATIQAMAGFVDCTASRNQGGNFASFKFQLGSGTISGALTLGPRNGLNGVVAADVTLLIPAGSSLTLLPGAILKMFGSIGVFGTLTSRGTDSSPITITSLKDDSVGGDTNADGPSQGSPGDWSSISFQRGVGPNASVLERTRLRFGGGSVTTPVPMVNLNASPKIDRCTLESARGPGIRVIRFIGVSPSITNCVFDGNDRPFAPFFRLDQIAALRDNVARNSKSGDHIQISEPNNGTIVSLGAADVAIRRFNLTNGVIALYTGVTIRAGEGLSLAAGVIIKVRSGSPFPLQNGATLVLDGRGLRPVVITSLKDDAFGGDTNGDGSASKPAPGDWNSIVYRRSTNGRVAYARLRYGGGAAASPGTVRCQTDLVEITSTRVDFSKTSGFYIEKLKGIAANWIAYRNESAGIQLLSGSFILQHATSTRNKGVGVFGRAAYTGQAISCISWQNARNIEQDNFVGVRPTRCIGSNTRSNFFVDPLFVDGDNGDLHVKPTSLAVGRADLIRAAMFGTDHDGNSRILDHALNGLALPDIGAYEVYQYRMGISGPARLGKTVKFTITGPGPRKGFQIVFLGPGIGEQFLPPFGMLLTGTLSTNLLLAVLPTGLGFELPIPDVQSLKGFRFAIQVLVFTELFIPAGGVTNAFLAEITE